MIWGYHYFGNTHIAPWKIKITNLKITHLKKENIWTKPPWLLGSKCEFSRSYGFVWITHLRPLINPRDPGSRSENGTVMEPKYHAQEVIGHPLLIIWEYDWMPIGKGLYYVILVNPSIHPPVRWELWRAKRRKTPTVPFASRTRFPWNMGNLTISNPWRIHGTNGIFTYMNGWNIWDQCR